MNGSPPIWRDLHNFDLFMKMMPELSSINYENNVMKAYSHFPLSIELRFSFQNDL